MRRENVMTTNKAYLSHILIYLYLRISIAFFILSDMFREGKAKRNTKIDYYYGTAFCVW